MGLGHYLDFEIGRFPIKFLAKKISSFRVRKIKFQHFCLPQEKFLANHSDATLK